MKNIFNQSEAQEVINRINNLTPATKAQWGKMDVSQMMAHCSVAYDMTYNENQKKSGAIAKFMLKLFVKPTVCGSKPYKKNGRTAPEFIIDTPKDFEAEKKRLIDYIQKTQKLGEAHFENKESPSFGAMTSQEWNTMFAKHLDHHLTQFGV